MNFNSNNNTNGSIPTDLNDNGRDAVNTLNKNQVVTSSMETDTTMYTRTTSRPHVCKATELCAFCQHLKYPTKNEQPLRFHTAQPESRQSPDPCALCLDPGCPTSNEQSFRSRTGKPESHTSSETYRHDWADADDHTEQGMEWPSDTIQENPGETDEKVRAFMREEYREEAEFIAAAQSQCPLAPSDARVRFPSDLARARNYGVARERWDS